MKIRLMVYLMLTACLALLYFYGRGYWYPVYSKIVGKKTVADVVQLYGESATERLRVYFSQAKVEFPPQEVAFLAIKEDKELELWAKSQGDWTLIKAYKILGASGHLGPKLKEGDRQVPEGVYRITGLNPNSAYHLSMKLNYPNEFDLKWASEEGRKEPGTNIFIHGKAASIGCLAIGDIAIEELFVLVNEVGRKNVQVIIAPTDPRNTKLVPPEGSKEWVNELYSDIVKEFFEISKT